MKTMSNPIITTDDSEYRFVSISDFKWCVSHNGEVQFLFHNKEFGIGPDPGGIAIYEAYKPETEKICKDADEVLEYVIDGVRLRDIITKVQVVLRTI
ncbi:MAG: hypothetical protein HFJ85_00575 [Oscillospiraceae bacterium]|nr:hypothetical protein [Oscillospiraceae bacterium]